ncbi:MAG: histidine phosphatase family protein [Oscillospiraceae bacterium]|nr:histidine phosphatase family protein [Oscillospiraceae bacterium]
MTTIYLIRHAEAEGNLYRRAHGQYDSAITARGYRQIASLRERFLDVQIDAIYASDLFRTRTTAGALTHDRDLPITPMRELREVSIGAWEDRPWGELAQFEYESLARFNTGMIGWQVEGSETVELVQKRMTDAFWRIARENEGKTVAIVSHGMALRILIGTLQGLSFAEIGKTGHADNTAVTKIEVEGDRANFVYINDNSHLKELSTFSRQSWWKSSRGVDQGIYYAPFDAQRDADFYVECQREAYVSVNGGETGFDGAARLDEARALAQRDARSVMCIFQEGAHVGVVQFDKTHGEAEGVGSIDFFYLTPAIRKRGFGIYLVGEAISFYRPRGRERLRVVLDARDEALAARFLSYDFEETARDARTVTLEKYIGFEQRYTF